MNRTPREDLIERLKDPEFKKAFGAEEAKLEIASLIYKARKKLGLTQKELSEKLGYSQPYIAKLEAGEANPTIGFVGRILATLDFRLSTSIDPLIRDTNKDISSIIKQEAVVNSCRGIDMESWMPYRKTVGDNPVSAQESGILTLSNVGLFVANHGLETGGTQ